MLVKRIEIQVEHGRLVARDERRAGLVLADIFMFHDGEGAAAALQRDGEEGRVGFDVLLLARHGREAEALVGLVDLRRLHIHVAVLRGSDEARHGCAAAGVLGAACALACLDFARRAASGAADPAVSDVCGRGQSSGRTARCAAAR